MIVEEFDGDTKYWFLYEGPIGGNWKPSNQYFATDTMAPTKQPRDYFEGDRLADQWRWAYFGDRAQARVMFIVHEQQDNATDTFSHLGNTEDGLASPDGMVVFGFGRGPKGIDPQLSGMNSFRIGLLDQSGDTMIDYQKISNKLNRLIQTEDGN